MTTFSQIFKRVLSSTNRVPKIIIGVFLSLVFFLPFAYGYLYRYTRQITETKDLELPEWTDWKGLLIDGFRFLAVAIPFCFLPVLIGWLISEFLSWLLEGINLSVPFSFFTHALFIIGVPTAISALIYFQEKEEDFKALLELKPILSRVLSSWTEWILILLALLGLSITIAPLYLAAFFFGLLILIPYMITIFAKEVKDIKQVVIEKNEEKAE